MSNGFASQSMLYEAGCKIAFVSEIITPYLQGDSEPSENAAYGLTLILEQIGNELISASEHVTWKGDSKA